MFDLSILTCLRRFRVKVSFVSIPKRDLNRPFAGSNYMVLNKLHWDANDAVGLSKQRNSYQSSPTFLYFESPTASFASRCNLFRTMWLDPAKGLFKENTTKYKSLSWKSRIHVRILIYRTWLFSICFWMVTRWHLARATSSFYWYIWVFWIFVDLYNLQYILMQ